MSEIINETVNQNKFPFELPALPYDKDALQPHMSSETFSFHHEKHHNAYVQNLNKLLSESPMKEMGLEEIIKSSAKDPNKAGIFNNAAQIWNHSFFWHSMRANGGGKPSGVLLEKIEGDFGSYEEFAGKFKTAGATQFGSGWAWLVYDLSEGKLKVIKTPNAETPITEGQIPVLTCDVWEHAYYIDYQNKRPDYISVFLEHLANWEFAEDIFNKYHK